MALARERRVLLEEGAFLTELGPLTRSIFAEQQAICAGQQHIATLLRQHEIARLAIAQRVFTERQVGWCSFDPHPDRFHLAPLTDLVSVITNLIQGEQGIYQAATNYLHRVCPQCFGQIKEFLSRHRFQGGSPSQLWAYPVRIQGGIVMRKRGRSWVVDNRTHSRADRLEKLPLVLECDLNIPPGIELTDDGIIIGKHTEKF